MFNVIKGNLINKNVKAVVIPNEIKKETLRSNEEEFKSSVQNLEKNEELFFSRENTEDENVEIEENIENEISKLEDILLQKKKEISLLEEEIELKIKRAEEDAKNIIEEAQEQARNEINDIKAEAWEDGFARGRQEALSHMEQNIESTLIGANNIITEASIKAREIFLNNKEEMINLSITMAEKIIKKEVKDKEVLVSNLIEAMKKAQNNKELKIYVNWEQIVYKEELREKLQSSFQGIENLEIIEDRTVSPGGCIIQTKLGKIDASIENQLEVLINSLYEE